MNVSKMRTYSNPSNRKAGFGLCELLAGLALLMTLSLIALGAMNGPFHAGLDQDAAQVTTALKAYVALTGHMPPGSSTRELIQTLTEPVTINGVTHPPLLDAKNIYAHIGTNYITYVPEFQKFTYVDTGMFGGQPANF